MRRAHTRYAGPELPFVRSSTTSVDAAAMAETIASTGRGRVLVAIAQQGARGLTDEEGVAATRLPPNTYRPRRVELMRGGLITASGERPTGSGRAAVVWVVSSDYQSPEVD